MTAIEKHIFANNPMKFSDKRSEALDEALNIFLETFDEYASKNELSNVEVTAFKKLIIDAYQERKATYFLESRLGDLSDSLDRAFKRVLASTFNSEEKEDNSNVFYYNKKHRLISNEQY
ncbi:hypothetical protein VB264_16810 [Arcicella aquatica]|uniref:Uncharacterized protein n=1 Tax=Arcicella aquatica TaxID=217141 RepID=A0ABU5QQV0_9BACT|nr:hypothetical protein [Arcicella aquatica]MEA5259463.1 hypothetical protein [Arcicella aquatica]